MRTTETQYTVTEESFSRLSIYWVINLVQQGLINFDEQTGTGVSIGASRTADTVGSRHTDQKQNNLMFYPNIQLSLFFITPLFQLDSYNIIEQRLNFVLNLISLEQQH